MSESPSLLLDTCALIWIAEDEALSSPATEALDQTHQAGRPVLISPISAWEIGMLVARGRLTSLVTPQVWFKRLLDTPDTRLAEMSPDLLISSSFLPGKPPRDPADRIIAATAREYGYAVVTRDEVLLQYGEQGHIRVIAC